MIIGVCGTFASGKDTVADYIADKLEYAHVSTGDLIRQYIRDNNLGEIDRDTMRIVANKMRAEKEPGYLVKTGLAKRTDNVVISGIRATSEAEALLAAGGHIVAVDAPVSLRYEWAKARGRIGDEITLDYFINQELLEVQNTEAHEQRIHEVMSMAVHTISNEGTLEELYAQIDEMLEKMQQEFGGGKQ